jgi:hypothetical protein
VQIGDDPEAAQALMDLLRDPAEAPFLAAMPGSGDQDAARVAYAAWLRLFGDPE